MRTVLLLLLAMLAVKTTTATNASGQEACSKPYIACVDKCVSRPSKSLQDTCMEACQTQNNACFSQVLGAPGPTAITVKDEPAKALASDEQPRQSEKTAKAAKPAMKPAERKPQ